MLACLNEDESIRPKFGETQSQVFTMTYKAKMLWYSTLTNEEKSMTNSDKKLPRKGAGKILKDLYEKNRGKSKASPELLEILKQQKIQEQTELEKNRKSAKDEDLGF